MALEFSGPPDPSLVTVCASESWLVQVTLVPTFTVMEAGAKAKFWMAMVFPEAGAAAFPGPLVAPDDEGMSIPGIDGETEPVAPGRPGRLLPGDALSLASAVSSPEPPHA